MELIKQKEIEITDIEGGTKTYLISKLPATVGRELVATYPMSSLPKIGEYKLNEQMMFKMLGYVAVIGSDGNPIRLSTKALVDNHCSDWEALAKIELAMIEYNTSFLGDGKASARLGKFGERVLRSIMKTLMDSLEQSSLKEKQHSKS